MSNKNLIIIFLILIVLFYLSKNSKKESFYISRKNILCQSLKDDHKDLQICEDDSQKTIETNVINTDSIIYPYPYYYSGSNQANIGVVQTNTNNIITNRRKNNQFNIKGNNNQFNRRENNINRSNSQMRGGRRK